MVRTKAGIRGFAALRARGVAGGFFDSTLHSILVSRPRGRSFDYILCFCCFLLYPGYYVYPQRKNPL